MSMGYTEKDITAPPIDFEGQAPLTAEDIERIRTTVQECADVRPGANGLRVLNLQGFLQERYSAQMLGEILRLRKEVSNLEATRDSLVDDLSLERT